MNTPLILSTLRDLGLTSYEAKIYLTLLERDTLTVPEISKLAEVPRPSAYQALDKLMSKGMCIGKPGRTKKYSASDPTVLEERFSVEVDKSMETELQQLEGLFKEKQQEIVERSSSLKQNIGKLTKELLPQYENSRQETSPLDYIEIIKDPYQIHKRFLELVGDLKEELLGFTKRPYTVPRERLKEQSDHQRNAVRRGIRVKSVYEISADEDERRWLFEAAESAAREGAEVRVSKRLPVKMMIFDSRVVMFTLADPVSKQPSLTTQIVEHQALAEALKILFNTLWEQAEDYHILKG